ncbi:UDP-N-acetylmuramoyl-L-alanine--D-glutamate ligase [Desulforhabdus amnigena]|jgi:UDP-N-acetylmuramoylalanine--D-glutamate ligase|uniref:UDP-N-acetylmuramoylalanine--D-glutamate ligase n=1 Tax=Desulforhabdus amnigena TaxID=40218 RepID=A0A9W6L8T5_9BACT|nr:UDP-N-acetylmuramoyl-L-alanine--D-glutamate ligase [Desulforhabdus amnigena]NLJ26745.1 UDP-N-acetylmuramoyl-L-alanine--D-glutamate ligase [Deltaproteobacteria bacterium]GLI35997.1 UDP-N-acetylmuramoylalanine--D-glutamate ligase [Desulforhabdus amnigena]
MKTEGDSKPQKALVVGMGISGQSVCELLLRQGGQVIANDLRGRDQFKGALDALEEKGCVLRLGNHDLKDFLEADQIIVSPGIPLDLEPLCKARDRGIEIVGELEWAWRQTNLPVVAVTGTNGKTTTTSLIGEMFKAAGRRVFVGGNIGTPLSRWILDGEAADLLVLEVSSFQLDTASRFAPDVGVLLNITEDHLDRYDSFDAYADSKVSLFARQNDSQVAVVNGDDALCREKASKIPGRLLFCSRKDPQAHARIEDHRVLVHVPWKEAFELSLQNCQLQGIHNEENILAAVLAASVLDVPPPILQRVIDGYRGLPHRVEWVRSWNGIDFYDDSKGTNVGAVVKALENFVSPVLLLLGGRDKLGSYGPLAEALKEKGKKAFAFGEAGPRIQKALEKWVPTQSYPDLEAAFKDAIASAESGDVVLLSPACSSFDQYSSYAQRGDHFKRLVRQLPDMARVS